MGREGGFEPPSPGWSPGALPSLCYPRTGETATALARHGELPIQQRGAQGRTCRRASDSQSSAQTRQRRPETLNSDAGGRVPAARLPLWPGNRPGSPNGGTAAAGRKNWAARGDSPVSKRRVGEIHLRQHQDQCSFELNRAHCHRAMIRQPKYLIECPMSIPKIGQTAAPPATCIVRRDSREIGSPAAQGHSPDHWRGIDCNWRGSRDGAPGWVPDLLQRSVRCLTASCSLSHSRGRKGIV